MAVLTPPLFSTVTLATPPATDTLTVMPLVAVVTELPLVKATSLPSTRSTSALPSPRLLTVRVRRSMFWPFSTVPALVPLNSVTAVPFSVKVGVLPVALSVGASLLGVTDTVAAMLGVAVLLLAPLSRIWVMVTTRLLAPGSSLLLW
ncbi:hypothetical protein D9M69_345650 [compost metagenome]